MHIFLVLPLLAPAALLVQEPAEQAAAKPAQKEQLSEAARKLLKTPALRQDDRTWTAREVLDRLAERDEVLWNTLTADPEYFQVYLNSPRFFDQTRWFSNLLLLDAADVPSVEPEAMLAEAEAWAVDRGRLPQEAEAVLASHPFEIEARARLMSLQPQEWEENRIRMRFHQSVPEFFGRIELSWIAMPLFDPESGRALGETERHARYSRLEDVAHKLGAEEISWKEAVADWDEDPRNREEDGYIGWIKRTEVKKYEYELLRQSFADLGFIAPEGAQLRGPILGDRWVYLVRVEQVRTQGVIELQRVRDRVLRAMREDLTLGKLAELGQGVERSILLPPTE